MKRIDGIRLVAATREAITSPNERTVHMESADAPGHIRIESMTIFGTDTDPRRLVAREALLLMKHLRQCGLEAAFDGDQARPVVYVSRKGLELRIWEPVILWLRDVSAQVVAGLIVQWLDAWAKSRSASGVQVSRDDCKIFLVEENGGERRYFHYDGVALSEAQFEGVLSAFRRERTGHEQSRSRVNSDTQRPHPIYLEHTAQIVGWGRVARDKAGLVVEDLRIDHAETLKRVRAGELKGLSVTAIARRAVCSTCGDDFVRCGHSTVSVDGAETCTVRIEMSELLEVSLVKEPVNPEALVRIREG